MGEARLSVGNTKALDHRTVKFGCREYLAQRRRGRRGKKGILDPGSLGVLCARYFQALLFALIIFLPSPVFPHAFLVKSTPAQRAVLLRAPAKIQLWFNEPLEAKYSTLSVADEAGKSVALTALEVGGAEPKRISAAVNTLPAGRYTVKYRVLSVDGHVVQDQFTFTIKQ